MDLKQMTQKVCLSFLMSMLCLSIFAQTHQVSGVVKDATGEPMIGANVMVKGTTNGTITDFDGNFTLSDVKASDVLVFSYIGCITQEIKVGNQTKFDVTLKDDAQALEEVVVIGYGTAKKKDLTGAVSTVKGADIARVPVTNAAEALTGKLAGVQITTADGSPDAEMLIRVRGGGPLQGITLHC